MTAGPDPIQTAPTRHALGLSYEDFIARLYLAAVQLGVPTRGGLRQTGFSAEDLELGLAELRSRGFLKATDDPDTWEVVPPRIAVSAYADQIEQRMITARGMIGLMETSWRRALGDEEDREMPLDVDLLFGVEQIAHRTGVLAQGAGRRLWWGIDASPASRRLLDQFLQHPDLLTSHGATEVRVMLDTSLLELDAARTFLHRCSEAGYQVRVGNGIPFSIILADDAAIVDLTSYDERGEGSFETRLAPTVSAVAKLLEEIFLLSTAYGDTVHGLNHEDVAQPPLDERDRHILALLTVGASDQVVARQIGVSVRTVERRVRYLMEHLGAATRFQAGVQAVRREWV